MREKRYNSAGQDKDDNRWWQNGDQVDQHIKDSGGNRRFDGMVSLRGREVDLDIAMVDEMEPPQKREPMHQAMFEVFPQIKEEDPEGNPSSRIDR
jgi:hypothetical protein